MSFKKGDFISVEFISESRTEFSGQVFKSDMAVVDRAEDGYIYGTTIGGRHFMCNDCDVIKLGDWYG